LTPDQLTGLTLQLPDTDSPSFTLQVQAHTSEGPFTADSGVERITVNVIPLADAPALVVQDASGPAGRPIALAISPALAAADPDASLALTIAGIPTDAVLSNAQGALAVTAGSLILSAAQLAAGALNGLSITPAQADQPNLVLHVTATTTDGTDAGASTASTSQALNVTVGTTLLVGANSGQSVIDTAATGGATAASELDFTGNITDQNLWFLQSGNDLKIDLLGTNTSVTAAGWFAGSANQLQEITAGGLKIDSQVSQLVQAMATYSASNPGFDPTAAVNSQVPNDPNVQGAIVAAWH
jgi:hypothetical protein